MEDAYKKCGNQDIVIVMGDLNAKVGGEQDPLQEIVGKHGLRERIDRGDLWVDWCATHEQVIMNTGCQHHQRHLGGRWSALRNREKKIPPLLYK